MCFTAAFSLNSYMLGLYSGLYINPLAAIVWKNLARAHTPPVEEKSIAFELHKSMNNKPVHTINYSSDWLLDFQIRKPPPMDPSVYEE